VDGAAKVMSDLEKAGISMNEVTDKLVVEGVRLFADAFRQLLEATGKTAGVKA
jgi:transaldolase/glucose-6-phosphate isomerase